jgi:hypothetical protein
MIRLLFVGLALAALPLGSRAGETVVRLTVRPMPAPKPALKYQLLPEVRELNPGNPIQGYVRCFAEQQTFFFNKQSVEDRARYQTMPLAELPKNLREYGGGALRQADWAARLDTPDWQILQRVQTEGMDLQLSELGPLQVLGAALHVRFRGQVAGRHFEEAVRSAKTMLALARHLGEYPTEAANRAGLSMAQLALATLEEMVQQPGCPNLYWALTDLPSPLVDLRKGVQGDRTLVAADLRLLRDDAPMTEAEVEKRVSRLSGMMGFAREQAGRPPRSVLRAGLKARAQDPEKVRAGRRRLVEAASAEKPMGTFPPTKADWFVGFSERLRAEALVEKLPPAQVILLDAKREYELRRDEAMKLLALAPWQIDSLTGSADLGNGGDGLFADLLPRVLEARRAQGRLEQRIGLLRHVEALRLYAADHGSKLPEKLADIPVPLPTDPFTGKPFGYKVDIATAQLHGGPGRGEEKDAGYNVRYEVIVQK